jgi:hypothetical protein
MSLNRPEQPRGRILPFRRREGPRAQNAPEGLGKYAGGAEPDDYRQRMINNGLALAVCILLVAIGVWLADTIAEMRKNQDCVLSGRRNCANLAVPPAGPR